MAATRRLPVGEVRLRYRLEMLASSGAPRRDGRRRTPGVRCARPGRRIRAPEKSRAVRGACAQNGAVPSSEPYDAGPVAALRRIAFLLERGREETYKVKAFRTAAATMLPLPDDEVERPRRGGHAHASCRASGSSTAAVIADAVEGRTPERLAKLERETGGPLVDGGDEIRAALRGDLHSHSDWSDGGSPIEEMAFTAIELGHDYLVLTDHSPRLTVANGLCVARLTKQLGVVDGGQRAPRRRRLHAAQGHRGRHPRRRRRSTRPTRCSTGSTSGSPACTPSCGMDKAPMTRRMVERRPQPAHQRARALHRPAGDRRPRHPAAVGVRREGGLRGLRRERHRGGDQLPPRAPRPADQADRARPRHRLPVLDRLRRPRARVSSTSRSTGAPAPRTHGIDPERIVNTWPRERLLKWSKRAIAQSLTPPRRADAEMDEWVVDPQPRLGSPHAVHRVVHRRWTNWHCAARARWSTPH